MSRLHVLRSAGGFAALIASGLVLAASLPAIAGGADATTTDTTSTVPTTTAADPVVPPGVTVGGVDVHGLTRPMATDLVRAAYLDAPVLLAAGPVRRTLRPIWLGVALAGVEEAVDRALVRTAPGDEPISVSWRAARVNLAATQLAHAAFLAARDAAWSWRGRRPVAVLERAGRRVVERTARTAIRAAILAPDARAAVVVPTVPIRASITRGRLPAAIVILRGSKRLKVFKVRHGRVRRLRTFGVATGQASYPTPRGLFRVVEKQRDPWWIPPNSDWAKGKKPIPPGPGNPLGTRWMGLSADGVGIHGTPDEASIGYSASHGCIRMRIRDAEWLFERVSVGSPVLIR